MHTPTYIKNFSYFLLALITSSTTISEANDGPNIDYLSFSQGAIPVVIEGAAKTLKVGIDRAFLAIDGDNRGFSLTPKPGAADTKIIFVYQLPALTTFSDFVIPNVFETQSPSQTFIKTIEIAGSDQSPTGPFQVLANTTLKTHAKKNQVTTFLANREQQVRWVRLTLSGGINIQRNKTFFEFSEIIGHGRQEHASQLNAFTGKWKGRGVLLELKQDGVRVNGCYDRAGNLSGTVDGNLLRATGKTNSNIPSTFILTITDDSKIIGVRSTNGAPFRLYTGVASPNILTKCSERVVPVLGCDAVIHGIHFDFDSATIRVESHELLDALYHGLKISITSAITIIGHTSNEGSDKYNEQLSQRRAESVTAALVARGIDANKISARGRGEKQPIADNATDSGRSLNRRVEVACR